MYATKIKMMPGCDSSSKLLEIDSIYIEGCENPGFFKKAVLHDFLKENPGTIQVKIWPYPNVIPATSSADEKYVRSSPNDYTHDNWNCQENRTPRKHIKRPESYVPESTFHA